jgi:hypothetical protein
MGQTAEGVTWATIRNAAHWSPIQARWVIAELKRSQLGIRKFSAKHKVGLKRIYYWQARFDAQGSQKRGPGRLVEVRVPQPIAQSLPPPTATRIEIELLSGRHSGTSCACAAPKRTGAPARRLPRSPRTCPSSPRVDRRSSDRRGRHRPDLLARNEVTGASAYFWSATDQESASGPRTPFRGHGVATASRSSHHEPDPAAPARPSWARPL